MGKAQINPSFLFNTLNNLYSYAWSNEAQTALRTTGATIHQYDGETLDKLYPVKWGGLRHGGSWKNSYFY